MLHDVDKTLEKMLRDRGGVSKKDIDVAFDQPTGEWAATLNRPTLNLFCFDLRENLKLRRPGLEREIVDGQRARMHTRNSRMDLSYLVTAWARKVEDEHQLLWRALGTFKKIPVIMPEDCEGDLRYQEWEMPLWVADMSVVGQRYNVTDIWSVLDNQIRLGFLVVTTVELDTQVGFESPLVFESSIGIDQIVSQPTEEKDEEVREAVTERKDGVSNRPGRASDIRIVHRSVKGPGDDKD